MQISDEQQDAVTEIINIGVGRAAASLSDMLEQKIDLCVPTLKVCEVDELPSLMESGDSSFDLSVLQNFDGGLAGRAMLAFPRQSGIQLGTMLGEGDAGDDDLSPGQIGVLEEIGNIVLNSVLGTIGNMTSHTLDYSVPQLARSPKLADLLAWRPDDPNGKNQLVVIADARFTTSDGSVEGSLVLFFDIKSLTTILMSVSTPLCQ